tara:strand:+ start:1087 stop:1458 length:372 start_codon:yes stop_codon:yes gene_type:complete
MAKKKIRSWANSGTPTGETNTETSKTMPDMHTDPRVVLENHVRGINPITGAILDKQHYYGDNILPYAKDLTFEELQMKRKAIETQIKSIINPQTTTNAKTENTEGDNTGNANVAETPSTQENL